MSAYIHQYAEGIPWFVDHCPEIPELVIGHTGIGKTEIPEARARKYQAFYAECLAVPEAERTEAQKAEVAKGPFGFAYLNFTAMEFADLVGLPFHDEKNGTTVFRPPEWLKVIEQFPRGIAVFDEVNRVELQTRQAYMQLLDRREIGNVKFPKGWHIVQTANPADDAYQVSDFDKALIRRSCVIPLIADTEVWQMWGMREYKDPRTGEPMHPKSLALAMRLGNHGLVQGIENKVEPVKTFNGLTKVSELLYAGLIEAPRELREMIVAGMLGADAAQMMESTLSGDLLKKLMDKFDRAETITGQVPEVMFDLLFLAFDRARKDPKKYAKALFVLWGCLPSDGQPVLAKSCYPWFFQFKKEFTEFKAAYRKWCVDNLAVVTKYGLEVIEGEE